MPHIASISELRNMNLSDLNREAKGQYALTAKMRLGINMKKEKDTALYRKEKKQLARLMTVLNEKNHRNQKNQRKKSSGSSGSFGSSGSSVIS